MSWTVWFALMAVPYYVVLVTGGALTWALYRRGFANMLSPVDLERRGQLTARERRTFAVVLGASLLWLTDAVHHLDPALPALLALVALLTPGLGPLVWSYLDRGVGWANFFVIGASISLAQALGDSGAAAWLARGLVGGLPGLGAHALASVVLLMLGATLLRAIVPTIDARVRIREQGGPAAQVPEHGKRRPYPETTHMNLRSEPCMSVRRWLRFPNR